MIEQQGIGVVSRTVTQLAHDVDRIVRTKSLNQRCGELALSYVRRQHSLEAVCQALERALPGVQLGRVLDRERRDAIYGSQMNLVRRQG
ncbi:MAG: hypothetical protein E5Y61_18010 [Mesorhizobium sp.]|nr:MAG: hypothetical protein E5Y61_18010 [Mesorhizobium sp.]